jgi:serine/threonine protein kinase
VLILWLGMAGGLPKIAGYCVEGCLGTGGCSKGVYHATKVGTGQKMALKVADLATQSEITRMEARILLNLTHPNIVRTYGFHEDAAAGLLLLELALADGCRARDVETWPEDRITKLILQICNALCYLKDRGVVHHDIKPENIIVNGAGDIKLIDFGICEVLPSTPLGRIIGIPEEEGPDWAEFLRGTAGGGYS